MVIIHVHTELTPTLKWGPSVLKQSRCLRNTSSHLNVKVMGCCQETHPGETRQREDRGRQHTSSNRDLSHTNILLVSHWDHSGFTTLPKQQKHAHTYTHKNKAMCTARTHIDKNIQMCMNSQSHTHIHSVIHTNTLSYMNSHLSDSQGVSREIKQ